MFKVKIDWQCVFSITLEKYAEEKERGKQGWEEDQWAVDQGRKDSLRPFYYNVQLNNW